MGDVKFTTCDKNKTKRAHQQSAHSRRIRDRDRDRDRDASMPSHARGRVFPARGARRTAHPTPGPSHIITTTQGRATHVWMQTRAPQRPPPYPLPRLAHHWRARPRVQVHKPHRADARPTTAPNTAATTTAAEDRARSGAEVWGAGDEVQAARAAQLKGRAPLFPLPIPRAPFLLLGARGPVPAWGCTQMGRAG